jgi:16S rRNA (guanine(966)-N(2))-methyltransferase RsmD
LFSILGNRVVDANVLDLFAGSGALGIEALSRGASKSVFVDLDREAVKAMQGNLERTRLSAQAQVVGQDVFAWLKRYDGTRFDLIFADPPYVKGPSDTDYAAMLMVEFVLEPLLSEDGMLIVETGQTAPPKHAAGWRPVESRRYGGSHLHFFVAAG